MTDNMHRFLTKLADLMETHNIEMETTIESIEPDKLVDDSVVSVLQIYNRKSYDFIKIYHVFINQNTIRDKIKENP